MDNRLRVQSRRKNNGQSNVLLFLFSMALPIVCACLIGAVAYQGGYLDTLLFSTSLTSTAIAQENAACQLVMQKAMQASADYCSTIDSNKACYGNNTLRADLVPGSTDQ